MACCLQTVGLVFLFVPAGIYLCWNLFPAQAKKARNRLYAWFFNIIMLKIHSKCPQQKIALFENFDDLKHDGATPHILEIGVGSGMNVGFFPKQCTLSCLEPNLENRPYVSQALQQYPGIKMDMFSGGFAENMNEFDDNTFDAVVCTYIMCSMRDPDKALSEIKRVLKPGGSFLFMEHVGAPRESGMRRVQSRLELVWSILCEGCHLTRESGTMVQQAGFSSVQLTHYTLEGMGMFAFLKFGTHGVAVK